MITCFGVQYAQMGEKKFEKKNDKKRHFQDVTFQQDNAPVHISKIIGNLSREKEWKVLEWPAYSLDLNPIENLWSSLKQR